jgi:hypothetical protein
MMHRCLATIAVALLLVRHGWAEKPPVIQASATVTWGPDRGQNFGTLFEIQDATGRVIAGAGFQAAYNTQPRSNRELLQVFVRPLVAPRSWKRERLPDIDSPATGFYPFSVGNQLYVHNRSEKGRRPTDPKVYRWDAKTHNWIGEPEIVPYAERVAGKTLAVSGQAVTYDGRVLLKPMPGASFGEHYYAGGKLFLKEANHQANPPLNRLVVCSWTPESDTSISRTEAWTLDLPIRYEFIYAFGQWRDEMIAVSNNGRVLRFAGERWTTLREPVPNVSYQVYAILTYHNRLLLGHYPTGEIYDYAGQELKLLKEWPPALTGVSRSAREAQTLALYGGDLYAGVWPWAELWRYDAPRQQWGFVERMFDHPQPTDVVVHPYESETKRVDAVANLWGQRITGLQPHGTGLVITTSSKGSGPWEPKFSFLTEQQRADYGATYLATIPGNLAVATTWKPEPTCFEITLTQQQLRVSQDGRPLGSVAIPEALLSDFQPARIVWGQGQFGPLVGQFREKSASLHNVAFASP